MFVVLVNVHVKPEHIETFSRAIADNADASVRDEPGCVQFTVSRSVADPFEFTFYERYLDKEAFEVHRRSPHFKRWREAAAECLVPNSQVNHHSIQTFDGSSASRDRHGE